MATTSLNLPGPLIRRLDEVAQREDRSRSYVVCRALEEWLDRAVTTARGVESAADAAAKEHLREHRRLSGMEID